MSVAMRNERAWLLTVAVLGALLGSPVPGEAQSVFRGWVALYGDDQLSWLSNEYRLDRLCPDPETADACRAEMMRPLVVARELRRAPDPAAPSAGRLRVIATPSQALRVEWLAPGSTEPVPFEPDLFLADWGYGPYFHQTFTERVGSWYALPAAPWPEPVWLEVDSIGDRVRSVGPEEIVEMDGEGWIVLEAGPDALTMRPEQEADMWCRPEEPPPLRPVEPSRFTRVELLDGRGHLKIRPKYMKGC